MPKYLSINVRCTECGEIWGELADPQELEQDKWECPVCKTRTGHRTVNSVTPLNSTVRLKKGDYEDLKAISKLEKQMFDKPVQERTEYKKEISERRKLK